MNEELNKVVDATQEPVVEVETEESVKTEVAPVAEVEKVEEPKKVQTKEENAKYAEVRRKAEAEARDKLVREMGKDFSWGEDITDYDTYKKARDEQANQKEAEDKGIDVEVVKELKELKEENAQYKTKEERNKQYQEFANKFPKVKFDSLSTEVWTEFAQGKRSLVDVYREFEFSNMKAKMVEMTKGEEAKVKNKSNAAASTGSLKSSVNNDEGEITQTEFDANRNDKKWVRKNIGKLNASRNKGLITH